MNLGPEILQFLAIVLGLALLFWILQLLARGAVAIVIFLMAQVIFAFVAQTLEILGPGARLALAVGAVVVFLWAVRKGIIWALAPVFWGAVILLALALTAFVLLPSGFLI